jgi:hypothetical protein
MLGLVFCSYRKDAHEVYRRAVGLVVASKLISHIEAAMTAKHSEAFIEPYIPHVEDTIWREFRR